MAENEVGWGNILKVSCGIDKSSDLVCAYAK
jgi:hypothetical protein